MIYLVLEVIDLGDHVIAAFRSESKANDLRDQRNKLRAAQYSTHTNDFYVQAVDIEDD